MIRARIPSRGIGGSDGIVDITDFGGVMGGPAEANTVALQAAVATGKMIHIPNGTLTINPVSFTTSVRLIGEGQTSVVQWAPGVAAGDLIHITGAGSSLELRDLTIDGSFQSFPVNSGYHSTIRYIPTAVGFDTRCTVHNCDFINGREFDVWVFGSLTPDAWVKAEFIGNRFRDGVEGQAGTAAGCIGCNDDVDLLAVGNTFDGPVDLGIGRVGIRYQQINKDVTQQQGSVVVSGNTFRNMGFAYAGGSIGGLGSCDVYSGASQVSITGNRIIGPRHRGICVKGDASDIAITGNVVKGLTGGVFAAACIISFSSQALGTAGSRMVISGNTCQADHGTGIFVDGADFATDPTAPAYRDVLVEGNAISVDPAGLAAYQMGIFFRYCKGVKVLGNTIRGSTIGIAMQSNCSEAITIANNSIRECTQQAISIGATSYTMDVAITDNFIQAAGTYGITAGATNSIQIAGNTIKDCGSGAINMTAAPALMSVISGNACMGNAFAYTLPTSPLVVETDNVWDPPPGFALVSRTIADDAITVTGERHFVDTEGGAASDDLTTINGGRLNQIVALYAASSSHAVTVKNGAGLRLGTDFLMSHANDCITLQKTSATAWSELSRTTAGATLTTSYTGADVALSPVLTYFDGPSVVLSKGSWLISATFIVLQSSAGPDIYSGQLYNSTAAATIGVECRVVSTGANAYAAGSISATIALVTTSTIVLRARNSTTANGLLSRYGTTISAARVG